jgi:hypothetical protein
MAIHLRKGRSFFSKYVGKTLNLGGYVYSSSYQLPPKSEDSDIYLPKFYLRPGISGFSKPFCSLYFPEDFWYRYLSGWMFFTVSSFRK